MSNLDVVSLDDLKEIVVSSLNDFYSKDKELFAYKTDADAVAERCMMFRIGWYILDRVRKNPKLQWANVDCEYNRNFEHPKSMYAETQSGIMEKTKNAVPDLLIHKRKSNSNNLLVIEFKKGTPTKDGMMNDEDKLLYFTDSKSEYKYKYGFYIELHQKRAKLKIFQDGKHMSHLDFEWKCQES